jgi:hypothetical protein
MELNSRVKFGYQREFAYLYGGSLLPTVKILEFATLNIRDSTHLRMLPRRFIFSHSANFETVQFFVGRNNHLNPPSLSPQFKKKKKENLKYPPFCVSVHNIPVVHIYILFVLTCKLYLCSVIILIALF